MAPSEGTLLTEIAGGGMAGVTDGSSDDSEDFDTKDDNKEVRTMSHCLREISNWNWPYRSVEEQVLHIQTVVAYTMLIWFALEVRRPHQS